MKERASQDDNADDPPPDPEHLFSVLVSVKSFLKFLSSHVVSTTTIACEFSSDHRSLFEIIERALQVYVKTTA